MQTMNCTQSLLQVERTETDVAEKAASPPNLVIINSDFRVLSTRAFKAYLHKKKTQIPFQELKREAGMLSLPCLGRIHKLSALITQDAQVNNNGK